MKLPCLDMLVSSKMCIRDRHFNLPVKKLLKAAGSLNPSFDFDFAGEMMERFELEGRKKFKQLSLGMKTMVSTIICPVSYTHLKPRLAAYSFALWFSF